MTKQKKSKEEVEKYRKKNCLSKIETVFDASGWL